MKIKYILDAMNSARDSSGNCYWALRFTDCESGKTVVGMVSGGESNIDAIRYEWHGGNWEPRDFYFMTHEYPKREFNRLTAGWKYAGCAPEQLVKFIREELEVA